MNLTIGCPVYNREWILPTWFDCLYAQEDVNLSEVNLVFGYTQGEDRTLDYICEQEKNFKHICIVDCNDLPAFDNRDPARFFPLVEIRNRIIDALLATDTDMYFSYDSDIIIQPDCLKTLIADDKDIVGPWMDIVPPGGIPNCASRIGATTAFRRIKPYDRNYPIGSVYRVDTVFAVFLMKRKVFENCRYYWHTGGEDFGWALDVAAKGYESWIDGTTIATHIYHKVRL